MANTYTQIVTASTLAAAGSAQSDKTKTTLQLSTAKYALEARVTNTASLGKTEKRVRVFFVCSNLNLTIASTDLAATLGLNARWFELEVKQGAGDVTVKASMPFVPTGPILYTWIEHSPAEAACAVDLWVTEIPMT